MSRPNRESSAFSGVAGTDLKYTGECCPLCRFSKRISLLIFDIAFETAIGEVKCMRLKRVSNVLSLLRIFITTLQSSLKIRKVICNASDNIFVSFKVI